MTVLYYSFLLGLSVFSTAIELPSFSECIKEKDRVESYYLNEYDKEDYSLETKCEQRG